MPRSREKQPRRVQSRRKSPCRPRTRCRKNKHTSSKQEKTHVSPKNTLSRIPELSQILGNKNELLSNIDKMSLLSADELKEKIEKIDHKIKRNKDSSKSMELNRERISLLTAYMAKNL
jgi:hypothetical protein